MGPIFLLPLLAADAADGSNYLVVAMLPAADVATAATAVGGSPRTNREPQG